MIGFIIGVIVGDLMALLTIVIMIGASKTKGADTNENTGDNGNE